MHNHTKVIVKGDGNPVVNVQSPGARFDSPGGVVICYDGDRPLVEALLANGVTESDVRDLVVALEDDRADNGGELPATPGFSVSAWVRRVGMRVGGFGNLAGATAAGNVISTLVMRHYGIGAV